MGVDPVILSALIGAAITLMGGGIAIFTRQRAMETKIDLNHTANEIKFQGVEDRLDAMEKDLGKIDAMAGDVAYIRGFLDGERRPHRKAKGLA